MSEKITVRIPKELKEEMKRLKGVNWSEVVRKAIEKKIRQEKAKWAVSVMQEISKKAKLGKPSHKIVRGFRDLR